VAWRRVSAVARIDLARLCIRELCLTLSQRRTICTVFFQQMHIGRGVDRLCMIETGVVEGVSGTALLALNWYSR
jgi:hypothetical protein